MTFQRQAHQLLRSVSTSSNRHGYTSIISSKYFQSAAPFCTSVLLSKPMHKTSFSAKARADYSTTKSLKEDSGSHSDFAPKRKVEVTDESEALGIIADQVKTHPVMLYMKGNPSMPMCGFSAKVVQILKNEGVDFSSVNVLDYPAIRDGVKKYSDWPTIPQLYINGEFIGGCDIVTSMHQSGELAQLVKEIPETK